MRTIILMSAACVAVSSAGCVSAAIASSGRNLSGYERRADVHAALGIPIASGQDAEHVHEDFRFRGKVRDHGSAQGAGMVGAFTLGLSEFVVVPVMLADLPRHLCEIHDVRYFYDEAGQVVRHEEREE
ncbi:MAG: hypothetical protein HOK71_22450 [Planctomycetaceae bacterium]|jgi:hypothetical protein|nr:hypothetical protein [Planctomycetaceae bacterium]MBT6487421.1 hypothetical protein [Planctomycetaceae bacterium]